MSYKTIENKKKFIHRLEILSQKDSLGNPEIQDFCLMISKLKREDIEEWIRLIDESNLKIDEKNRIKRRIHRLATASEITSKIPSEEKDEKIEYISDHKLKETKETEDDIADIMGQIESHYKKPSTKTQQKTISETQRIKSDSEDFLSKSEGFFSEEESLEAKKDAIFSDDEKMTTDEVEYYPVENITNEMIQKNLAKLSLKIKLNFGKDALKIDNTDTKSAEDIKEWILDNLDQITDQKSKAITGALTTFSDEVLRQLIEYNKKAKGYSVDQIKDKTIEKAIPEMYKKIIKELGDDALQIRNIKCDKAKYTKEWILENLWLITKKSIEFTKEVYDFVNSILTKLMTYNEKMEAKLSQEIIDVDYISEERIEEATPRMCVEIYQDLGDDALFITNSASPKAMLVKEWIFDHLHYIVGLKYKNLTGNLTKFTIYVLEHLIDFKNSKEYRSKKKNIFQFSKKSDDRSIEQIKNLDKDRSIVETLQRQTEYEELDMTQEQLDQHADKLLKMAQEELLPEDLIIDDIATTRAKRLLRWISTKLDNLNIKIVEEPTKKKIATQLFARIWEKLKHPEIEQKILGKKREKEVREKYEIIHEGLFTIFRELIRKKGEKVLEIEDPTSKEAIKIIKWIANNLKLITKEKLKKKEKHDHAIYAFNLILIKKDKFFKNLQKEESEEKTEQEQPERLKIEQDLSKEDLVNLTASLINRIKRELGYDALEFSSIKSPEAKKVASWIYSQVEFITQKELDNNAKKEFASKLFVEMCKEIKGKDWVIKELQK